MTNLNIDVGATACIAKCEHCRFGAQPLPGLTLLSSDTLRVTEKVLAYGKAQGQKTRLAFTSPLLSMTEVPFLKATDALSVSFESLTQLQTGREQILGMLEGFTGNELQLQLNHIVLSEYMVPQCMGVARQLFDEVSVRFPQVTHVYIGFNHNTVTLPSAALQQESVLAGYGFIRSLELALNRQRDFGHSEVRLENTGSSMQLRATVGVGKRHYSLLIRYIRKLEEASDYMTSPFLFNIKELSLLVVDRGVHVAHFASAINQAELWFTHGQFEELLDKAVSEGVPLLEVCKEAARQRRNVERVIRG